MQHYTDFTAFSLASLQQRMALLPELAVASRFLRDLSLSGAQGLVRCASLAFAIDRAPAAVVHDFAAHLEADLGTAKKVMEVLLKELSLPRSLATTVLRVQASPQLHLPIGRDREDENNPFCGRVFLSVLRITGVTPNKAKQTCIALSKCITLTRDMLWDLRGRVMVLCVAAKHSIDLRGVIPGPSATSQQIRQRLYQSLAADTVLADLFSLTPEDIVLKKGKEVEFDGDHAFFIFSFGEELHLKTLPEVKYCLRNIGIAFTPLVSGLVADVD